MTANSPGRLLKNLLLGDGEQWRFNVEPQGRAGLPGKAHPEPSLTPGPAERPPEPCSVALRKSQAYGIPINGRDYAALSSRPSRLAWGLDLHPSGGLFNNRLGFEGGQSFANGILGEFGNAAKP